MLVRPLNSILQVRLLMTAVLVSSRLWRRVLSRLRLRQVLVLLVPFWPRTTNLAKHRWGAEGALTRLFDVVRALAMNDVLNWHGAVSGWDETGRVYFASR